MTRKHFELIARAIWDARTGAQNPPDVDVVARALAREFTRVNSRFNTERFLTACGVFGGK